MSRRQFRHNIQLTHLGPSWHWTNDVRLLRFSANDLFDDDDLYEILLTISDHLRFIPKWYRSRTRNQIENNPSKVSLLSIERSYYCKRVPRHFSFKISLSILACRRWSLSHTAVRNLTLRWVAVRMYSYPSARVWWVDSLPISAWSFLSDNYSSSSVMKYCVAYWIRSSDPDVSECIPFLEAWDTGFWKWSCRETKNGSYLF